MALTEAFNQAGSERNIPGVDTEEMSEAKEQALAEMLQSEVDARNKILDTEIFHRNLLKAADAVVKEAASQVVPVTSNKASSFAMDVNESTEENEVKKQKMQETAESGAGETTESGAKKLKKSKMQETAESGAKKPKKSKMQETAEEETTESGAKEQAESDAKEQAESDAKETAESGVNRPLDDVNGQKPAKEKKRSSSGPSSEAKRRRTKPKSDTVVSCVPNQAPEETEALRKVQEIAKKACVHLKNLGDDALTPFLLGFQAFQLEL
jgi:fused signal recognition particle receptor